MKQAQCTHNYYRLTAKDWAIVMTIYLKPFREIKHSQHGKHDKKIKTKAWTASTA